MSFIHKFITKTLSIGQSSTKPVSSAVSLWEMACKDVRGQDFSFASLKGKVVIVTNVASFCGFTNGHYAGFKTLLDKYGSQLEIVAFPSNQFLNQEYSDPNKVCSLAEKKAFKGKMMELCKVNGPEAHPVWNFLKVQAGTDNVEWNFECYLIHPQTGKVVKRFMSKEGPDTFPPHIEALLKEADASPAAAE